MSKKILPKNLLVAVVGPTASGKSAVGMELARKIKGEVISCDSMQVYRGMPVCTQASAQVVKGVRHHLVSFLDVSRRYSAAAFRKDAEKLIRSMQKRHVIPVVVGGTGLYLRALLDGLFDTPGPSENRQLRKKLYAKAEELGSAALHADLKKVDPQSAEKIHPNDARRIVRALEVWDLTGKPLSEWKPARSGIRGEFECRVFLIDRDRQELYGRIEKRAEKMMRGGLLAEVKRLGKKRLSLTAQTALGIREMKEYLAGRLSQKEALELLKKNTRHYAKRQLSWFRHERDVERIEVRPQDTPAGIAKEILKRL